MLCQQTKIRFTLHDPSIEGKKGFEVSSKKVFDDIAFIFAGIAE